MHRIVLSGGPGAGKTTVLGLLSKQGFAIGEDAARNIIRERKSKQLSPRPDDATFAREIFDRERKTYNTINNTATFYERGIVDAVGALVVADILDDKEASRIVQDHPYELVFVFPPWQEIYRTDEERDHTFEHAVRVFEATVRLYRHFHYEPIEVPIGVAETRVDFILNECRHRLGW